MFNRSGLSKRRIGLVGLGLMVMLALGACAADEPLPTDTPAPPPPSAMPVPEAETAEGGAVPEMVVVPSVSVVDQEIADGAVTIAEVVSDGPGWLVIHAQAEGKPGPVLGYSPVNDGHNESVVVKIDLDGATETLYAMLHTDGGEIGTWEFPGGPDGPVQVDGKVITPPFAISGLPAAPAAMPVPSEGQAEAQEMVVTPSVAVVDQEIIGGAVTIAEVVSDGPGWLVIHAQAEGKPGPVLGLSPVADGANADVTVEIDLAGATETLYAMLHADAGEVGAWEFPGGPDVPVTVDEGVVTPPFRLLAASGEIEVAMTGYSFQPGTLVVTAGTTVTWINNDGQVRHDVASDTGLFQSELFNGDDSFSYTFDQPGVYPYYCHPHGGPGGDGMAGTIVVLAAG